MEDFVFTFVMTFIYCSKNASCQKELFYIAALNSPSSKRVWNWVQNATKNLLGIDWGRHHEGQKTWRNTGVVFQTARDLQILRRERLRVRNFLNSKYCSRVGQRHFGGKTWQQSSLYYEFKRECRSGGNKLSNVRSFTILRSGEGSASFNNENSSIFSGEKKYNEEFRGVCFLTVREKTLNQISYSYSFSPSNLKVSSLRIAKNFHFYRMHQACLSQGAFQKSELGLAGPWPDQTFW